ncbi:Uncharacterised protein [Mycobacteroides abscessus subsp. abscessus]|nr:Uncharacterised protein [Mycobacteroides abscessus subsp. abscessus]
MTVRSVLASCAPTSTALTCRPGRASVVSARFWKDRPTWNSGLRAVERTGLSTSTSRSNGTSALAKASRSRSRTSASRSANRSPGSTWVRNTSVLTNMPIRSSSSRSPRPAIGVPTAMSSVPDSRASSTARAVCTTMNSEALFARASSCRRACSSGVMSKRTALPWNDCAGGRGRSEGRSS